MYGDKRLKDILILVSIRLIQTAQHNIPLRICRLSLKTGKKLSRGTVHHFHINIRVQLVKTVEYRIDIIIGHRAVQGQLVSQLLRIRCLFLFLSLRFSLLRLRFRVRSGLCRLRSALRATASHKAQAKGTKSQPLHPVSFHCLLLYDC